MAAISRHDLLPALHPRFPALPTGSRPRRSAQRERFADHSRETFDAVLDTCERIAREKYAPFNRTVDLEEPRTDGEARCTWCCRRPP
jgi:hypothetical protein